MAHNSSSNHGRNSSIRGGRGNFSEDYQGHLRRQQMALETYYRPLPTTSSLYEKASFAESLIKEHEAFSDQEPPMYGNNFESLTRHHLTRIRAAGDILRGMFIRGTLQAAVFESFMQLCLQGVCSLNSLEHPIDWNHRPRPGSYRDWISRMLAGFEWLGNDFDNIQGRWRMSQDRKWIDYYAPLHWLATMIGRSFTDLEEVLGVLRAVDLLGRVDEGFWLEMGRNDEFDAAWKADVNLNRADEWRGSGTFAFWLPEDVNREVIQKPLDDAIIQLSRIFYGRFRKTEEHYCRFFDITSSQLDSDAFADE